MDSSIQKYLYPTTTARNVNEQKQQQQNKLEKNKKHKVVIHSTITFSLAENCKRS